MNFSELVAQAVLRTRSDAIIAADRDGIICFWNPGAERMFGHVSGEAIGRSLDLIIPERLRQRHWDGFRQTMETGRSRYGEGDLLSVPATGAYTLAMASSYNGVPRPAAVLVADGDARLIRRRETIDDLLAYEA